MKNSPKPAPGCRPLDGPGDRDASPTCGPDVAGEVIVLRRDDGGMPMTSRIAVAKARTALFSLKSSGLIQFPMIIGGVVPVVNVKGIGPGQLHLDGGGEAEHVRQIILSHNPRTIINGRLQGYGDYETPEQNIPVSRPPYPWWEMCYTTNNNWGYHPDDTAFKTLGEVISVFADVI